MQHREGIYRVNQQDWPTNGVLLLSVYQWAIHNAPNY
jgi:hypothetical protein